MDVLEELIYDAIKNALYKSLLIPKVEIQTKNMIMKLKCRK